MKTKKSLIKKKNNSFKCKKININKLCIHTKQNYKLENNFGLFFFKIMKYLGVNNVVGMAATAIIDMYYQLNTVKNLNHYLIRNELNGGYMSMGTSRLTSLNIYKRNLTLNYCDLGPGLANTINPICASTLEQIPCIFITATATITNQLPQNIDSSKIIENICKSYLVITTEDIINGSIIKKIHETLIKGFSYPRGAIVFIFKDQASTTNSIKYLNKLSYYKKLFSIFNKDYGFELKKEIKAPHPFTGLYNKEWVSKKHKFLINHKQQIININNIYNLFNEKLSQSKQPVMLIGLGALDYIYDLIDFCRNAEIPYILTLALNGYGDYDDKYYAFRMGHTSTYCGNNTIMNCDLLITWGTSLSKYVIINDNTLKHIPCIINININPEIYHTPFVNYYIINDGKIVLNKINKKNIINTIKRPDWLKIIEHFKKKDFELNSYYYSKNDNEKLKHGDIYITIQKYVDNHIKNTNKKVFFFTDTGSCQPFTASFVHYKTKNYFLITDGKYGSIGNALGEVMGAAINCPNDLFICIAGDSATLDGSISDYITLMETNIKNIIFIIFENSGIGFISETSIEKVNKPLNYGNGYKYVPNWKNLFQSFLIDSYIVKSNKEMDTYVNCAFNNLYKKCTVLICVLPHDAFFSPIVNFDSKYINNMEYFKFDENSKANNCRYLQT